MCAGRQNRNRYLPSPCAMPDRPLSPLSCVGSLPPWRLSLGICPITKMPQESVARMERSAIREHAINEAAPDFAALHPGYGGSPRFSDLRAAANLFKRINLIPPVQSHLQKYFPSRQTQIKSISPAIPALWRGVSRSSRTLGTGCDGRGSVGHDA